ncbi:MAG: DUF3823 domain-containing protein [Dysgonamonadaceae bacterium]|jgi:hypothetical protein|nr:DUF3823 domain-containing protein [Dysgonamonadaceae bacterium]
MKNIFYLITAISLLCLASCMEVDNWDAPDAAIVGTITDIYTGKPIVQDQNEWQIRIWETSWEREGGVLADVQTLATKNDGTYSNNKLFAGTYMMLPYDGPFFPLDTIRGVVLKSGKTTTVDFTVRPMLQIIDFETEMTTMKYNNVEWPALIMRCKLKAPIRDSTEVDGKKIALPNLYDLRPFVSRLKNFCGNANYLNLAEYRDNVRIQIRRSWKAEMEARFGITTDTEVSGVYQTDPMPLKSGWTYYVRIGCNVDYLSRRYAYSPIVEIVVP